MIKHLAEYPSGKEYDLCIIGSGPAGLTLVHELGDSAQTICVLESGPFNFNMRRELNDLKKITSLGEIIIKDHSRERALGGTSNTWTGLSAPLDPVDLKHWPISYDELCTYYRKLEPYGFAPFDDFFSPPVHSMQPIDALGSSESLEEKIFIAAMHPVNFGTKFRHIFQQPNIDLYVGATVTKIISASDHTSVTSVEVMSASGTKTSIKAKTIVICAGGLESSRLLLMSDGLGNRHDQVGRYLMNHPKGNAGVLTLRIAEKASPVLGLGHDDMSMYSGIRVREDVQKKLNILNCYARLEPQFSRDLLSRIIGKLGYRQNTNMFIVRNFMDMEPRADNRLTLGDEKDRYGNPLPIVAMHTSELDRKSLIELHALLKQEIEKKDLGKFESELDRAPTWPIIQDASHHLGGTIIGKDERTSVVNPNLKVHSVDNLYVCSSSVFPSAGCANPTYTICALAVRLANHLRRH